MQAFGQAGVAPAAWARIQLVRGQSNGAVWQIDSNYPQARLSIGSDAAAGWPINAFGVQPNHFEIYWDGGTLYLADTLRVGGVTLNGKPLGAEWVQVRGRGEVVFGQASMSIETSDANARPIQNEPSIAKRVSVTPDGGTQEIMAEATRVADPSWSDADALAAESTRIGDETMIPSTMGAPSLGGPAAPSLGGGAPSQRPPPPPPGGARPRLGGSPGGGGGLREQAPTLMAGLSAPQEATRMVSLDDVPASPGAPSAGAPSFGAPPGGFGGPPPPAFPSAPGMGAPSMGGPGGFAPTTPPNPPAGGFAMPGPPGGSATGGFAPPPVAAPANAGASVKDALAKVPRRTLVMGAGAAVVALLALLLLMPSGEGDPPPPGPLAPPYVPGAAAVPAPGVAPGVPPTTVGAVPPTTVPPTTVPPTTVPPTVGAVPPTTVPPATVPPTTVPPTTVPPTTVPPTTVPPTTVPPTTVPPTTVPPTATPPAAAGTPPVIDPSVPTDDRRAADLAIAGRFAEALPLYQALALAHPDQPEYGMMVRMLERRIEAANCINGILPDGRPCTAGGY